MTASDNNLRLAFSVDKNKFPGLDDQELFDIRQFSVHEEMSGLFEVNVVAVVEEPNIPLQAFVGRAAALRVQTTNAKAANPVRVWAGVCAHMSHLHGADPGVSAYHVSIVPVLWRLTMRKNSRIFQHKSTVDIVTAILAEWQIKATWQLAATYDAHEYCVQYGETDYAFICRLLEDAGISYFFDFKASSGKGNDIVALVFDDAPQTARKTNTRTGSLAYAGNQTPAFGSLPDFCTTVSLTQRVTAGKVTLRDFDFRLPPTLNLSAQVSVQNDPESVYEQFEYVPGEFSWEPGKNDEGTKALADKYSNGKPARSVADAQKGNLTKIALEAARRRQVLVGFHTNAIDLHPGLIFAINQEATTTANHPRVDLTPDDKLLIIGTHLEGEHSGEWTMTAQAVYASLPLRPERRTPKPTIFGVQSAIVVGPKGQEVWTDEFGRVRVQFHWDREGKYDDNSSCWMRVSQAWAGGGFGMVNIPRVGHEVLVQFFEGDPDLPIIVGRVHNLSAPTPYALPDNQTVSGIKTNSLPGGGGYNEIKFDDKAGAELIHVQAQSVLSTVVKATESRDVGANRSTRIGGPETLDVSANRTTHIKGPEKLDIGAARTTSIATTDTTGVGTSSTITVGKKKPVTLVMRDDFIQLSTGGASIEISGNEIYLNAGGGIHLHAGGASEFTVNAGTLEIQGGPNVEINKGDAGKAVSVDAVSGPAAPAAPTPPGGGPKGTPPNLPTGGSSIDKPGPLSADVDVETPTNDVKSPVAAVATAVKTATKTAPKTGLVADLKADVKKAFSSTGEALLKTVVTDVSKGDFKDLTGKKLLAGAEKNLKTSLTGSLKTEVLTGVVKELPNVIGTGSFATKVTAALAKAAGVKATAAASTAVTPAALKTMTSSGTALAVSSGKKTVGAVTNVTTPPAGPATVTVATPDATQASGTTTSTMTHTEFTDTYDTVVSGDGG